MSEGPHRRVHLRSAERLRALCCANRGTFIKVGQHLGALDYLLPGEYTSTLRVLHSRAPQSSLHQIQQVIREDLGKERSMSVLWVHESRVRRPSDARVELARAERVVSAVCVHQMRAGASDGLRVRRCHPELLVPWQVSRLAVEPVGGQTAGGPLAQPSFTAQHLRLLVLCLLAADSPRLTTPETPLPAARGHRGGDGGVARLRRPCSSAGDTA
ncbi:unnamed protein product [Arctogadus glacialis]